MHNHDVASRMIYNSSTSDDTPKNYENYLKNQWQPYCTLATKLSEKELINAIKLITKNFMPITAKIKSVLLVESEPYFELFEYRKTIKTRKIKKATELIPKICT